MLLKRKAGDLNGVISYKLLPDGPNYYTHHGIYLLDLKMFLKILDLSGLCLIPSILCVCVCVIVLMKTTINVRCNI